MPTDLLIVGAGGHAKVVVEAARSQVPEVGIIVADQDKSRSGGRLLSRVPIVFLESWAGMPGRVHVAIGDNLRRRAVISEVRESGREVVSIEHAATLVSPSARIGAGSFLAAAVVVSAETKIGECCIVNHAAIVDHDCEIGDFTHVGPNVTLGGGVRIGRGCLIGSGATLLPGVCVGDNVTVGAGAVVLTDVEQGQTVAGVPAKNIKT